MTQTDLFAVAERRAREASAPRPPEPPPSLHEQEVQLARVTGRIGASVVRFCRARAGKTFTASELAAFVMSDCGGAPASADRVLRALRREGQVDVELVDRAASLYRVVGVSGAAAAGDDRACAP